MSKSPSKPTPQSPTKKGTKAKKGKKEKKKIRRLPGPAGNYWKTEKDEKKKKILLASQTSDKVEPMLSLNERLTVDKLPLYDPDLWKGPWLTAINDNKVELIEDNGKLYISRNIRNNLFINNIGTIRMKVEHIFRVSLIMVLIKQLNVVDDAIALVIDPFSKMKATIHRKVIKQYSSDIHRGSVLILSSITVYQSSPNDYYLTVTMNNINRIISYKTKIPIQLIKILKIFHHKLGIKAKEKKKRKKEEMIKKNKLLLEFHRKNQKTFIIKDHFYDKPIDFAKKSTKNTKKNDKNYNPFLIGENPKKKRKLNNLKVVNIISNDENVPILPASVNKNKSNNDDENVPILLSSVNKTKPILLSVLNKKSNDNDTNAGKSANKNVPILSSSMSKTKPNKDDENVAILLSVLNKNSNKDKNIDINADKSANKKVEPTKKVWRKRKFLFSCKHNKQNKKSNPNTNNMNAKSNKNDLLNKQNKTKHINNKSPTSRFTRFYEEELRNNNGNMYGEPRIQKQMNMFADRKNTNIPKNSNFAKELFSQVITSDYFFGNDSL